MFLTEKTAVVFVFCTAVAQAQREVFVLVKGSFFDKHIHKGKWDELKPTRFVHSPASSNALCNKKMITRNGKKEAVVCQTEGMTHKQHELNSGNEKENRQHVLVSADASLSIERAL